MSSAARNHKTDHMLARALTLGGVAAFALTAVGTLMFVTRLPHAELLLRIGVIALISTPVLRIAIAVVAFYLERDYKYMVIASIVFAIVLLGAILRVAI